MWDGTQFAASLTPLQDAQNLVPLASNTVLQGTIGSLEEVENHISALSAAVNTGESFTTELNFSSNITNYKKKEKMKKNRKIKKK